MARKIMIILYFVIVFIGTLLAKEKPHADLFKSDNGDKALYCTFCHKLRYSANIVSLWSMDKKSSYFDYVSATIKPDTIIPIFTESDHNVSSIVDLCLGCHEMTKHDNDYGHSFNSKVIGNKKTKINVKSTVNDKVSGKLKLYNNVMTCTTCHDPHGSSFKLLADSREKLCNDCHDK